MKHHKQDPSSRRVQAFIKPLYYEKLKMYGYTDWVTKFYTVATLLDNGKLSCLLCDPWHKYCPDYDRGYDVCAFTYICDFDTEYKPKTIYDTYTDFHKHFVTCYKDNNIAKNFLW